MLFLIPALSGIVIKLRVIGVKWREILTLVLWNWQYVSPNKCSTEARDYFLKVCFGNPSPSKRQNNVEFLPLMTRFVLARHPLDASLLTRWDGVLRPQMNWDRIGSLLFYFYSCWRLVSDKQRVNRLSVLKNVRPASNIFSVNLSLFQY